MRLSNSGRGVCAAGLCALLLLLFGLPAHATVNIVSPPDGHVLEADLCPLAPCPAALQLEVFVSGAPIDYLYLDVTDADGVLRERELCRPADPIEEIDACQALPFYFPGRLVLIPGQYTIVARAVRGNSVELSPAISVTVLAPSGSLPGPVHLSEVTPVASMPGLSVWGEFAEIFVASADNEISIIGGNLSNNPFLRVFLTPITPNEQSINELDPLPVSNWCMYEAEIVTRSVDFSGRHILRVRMPVLPLTTAFQCGLTAGPQTSIFNLQWRWVIQDNWVRPQRTHSHYAIPSPRQGSPWQNTPAFALLEPDYPLIDGFGFRNHSTDASYNEFLTVYGNNAYLCVGALGLCATRIPDPLYHTLWYGLYLLAIDNTGGSCNGLSATSLLFHHEQLQTEDFEADVQVPFGFDSPGPGSVPATDKDGNPYLKGVAKYADTNFCTPFCSPPRPGNLWATIRQNHGVQLSREFLQEMFLSLGQALVDVGDLGTLNDDQLFQGIPNLALDKVSADPLGHVLCFTEFGGGHCVTPYAVDGTSIRVYDNNAPGSTARSIDIVGGDYDYSQRSKPPNKGNFIIAYPLELWQNSRRLFGLGDALDIDNLNETLEFLAMILAGSADMTLSDNGGRRYGWEDDDSFSNSLPGVFTSSSFGPSDDPNRNGLFFVAESSSDSKVTINADGGLYAFHAGAGDQLLQLEAGHAVSGDKDEIRLQFSEGLASGFGFRPQRTADALVLRGGLSMGEQDSAVFSYLGLSINAGEQVALTADRQLRQAGLSNAGSQALSYQLMLDVAAGATGDFGRLVYGPFELASGASQVVRLHRWPDASTVLVLTDIDNDGSFDSSREFTGQTLPLLTDPGQQADLSVTKTADAQQAQPTDVLNYSVTVSNVGLTDAPEVLLNDRLSRQGAIVNAGAGQGSCSVSERQMQCHLGTISPGDSVTVDYSVIVNHPGELLNQAIVSSGSYDSDWTNNSGSLTVTVPVHLDIKPGSRDNRINLKSRGVIPVAILGADGFDVREIDVASVRFTALMVGVAHPDRHHFDDINADGHLDQVFHFSTAESAAALDLDHACLTGRDANGHSFTGCDAISTGKPGSSRHSR